MEVLKVKNTVFKPGRPKVVVPITGNTPEKIIEECEKAAAMPCDVIEWRADYYLAAIPELENALRTKEAYLDLVKILDDVNYIADTKPVIFTVRRKGQGGEVSITKEQNDSIWSLVAQSQLADFIDVELFDENDTVDEYKLQEQIDQIHEYGSRVILSYHDFNGMPSPEEMVNLISVMHGLGPDVCKVAAMANSEEDARTLLKATAFLTRKGIGPLVTMAMGEAGTTTRVAAGKYGSCMTFASGAQASAPGQADVFTMKKWLDKYYGE
ncbi:MAG: type I 3-dehydroquinate dehydratase [Bacillota bacterium]|nr:type I 3-dehydroquinate dehydratase [Bacillota bacterium]